MGAPKYVVFFFVCFVFLSGRGRVGWGNRVYFLFNMFDNPLK